jgi:hypothetical protein
MKEGEGARRSLGWRVASHPPVVSKRNGGLGMEVICGNRSSEASKRQGSAALEEHRVTCARDGRCGALGAKGDSGNASAGGREGVGHWGQRGGLG